jgi:CDP-glycerol glycerophosphotransferase
MGVIIDAFLEENFTKKTVNYFKKLPKRMGTAFWHSIGDVSRKIVSKTTKVDDNTIVFFSNTGRFDCNPRAIYEEMKSRNLDYDLIWVLNKANQKIAPKGMKYVTRFGADSFKAYAKAKVWIMNGESQWRREIPIKSDQILINTWHGSLGIKRIDPAHMTTDKGGTNQRLTKYANSTTYNISNSQFETDVYHESYWPNTPIWTVGHPRNDKLAKNDPVDVLDMKSKILYDYLNLDPIEYPIDTNIMLYAPTFRDNGTLKPYDINWEGTVRSLEERFGGKWIVFSRLHPRLAGKQKLIKYIDKETVFNLTPYPDIQDLLLISDAAITDYSSWVYDYVLTKRPAFLYANDYLNYEDSERGFYYSLYDTPFPVALNNQGLEDAILNFDDSNYAQKCQEFLDDKGCIDDGLASKRTVDMLLEVLEGSNGEK